MQVSEEMLRAATIAVYAVSAKAIEPALGIKVCAFDELPERDRKLHEDYARAALDAALAATGRSGSMSAQWTYDPEAEAYYFAPMQAAPPPYLRQRHVDAIIDIASDGTLAGVELIDNMPPPPLPQPPRHKEG